MTYKTIAIELTNNIEKNNKQLLQVPEAIRRQYSNKLDNIEIPKIVTSDEVDQNLKKGSKIDFSSQGNYFSYFEKERLKLTADKKDLPEALKKLDFKIKPLEFLYPKIVFGYLDEQYKGFKNEGVPLTTMVLCYQYGNYLHIRFYDTHSGMSFDPKLYKVHDKSFVDADINAIKKSYKLFGHPVTGKSETFKIDDTVTDIIIKEFFDSKVKEMMDSYFKVISDNLVLAYSL